MPFLKDELDETATVEDIRALMPTARQKADAVVGVTRKVYRKYLRGEYPVPAPQASGKWVSSH